MKRRILSGSAIFLVCAIPWAFLLALCDRTPGVPFWAALMGILLVAGAMAWFSGKAGLISWAIAGNAVSCLVSSLLFLWRFGTEDYYFSPFRPVDYMLFLSIFLLSLQVTLWRIQRKAPAPSMIEQFAERMMIVFAVAVTVVFLLLLISQWALL